MARTVASSGTAADDEETEHPRADHAAQTEAGTAAYTPVAQAGERAAVEACTAASLPQRMAASPAPQQPRFGIAPPAGGLHLAPGQRLAAAARTEQPEAWHLPARPLPAQEAEQALVHPSSPSCGGRGSTIHLGVATTAAKEREQRGGEGNLGGGGTGVADECGRRDDEEDLGDRLGEEIDDGDGVEGAGRGGGEAVPITTYEIIILLWEFSAHLVTRILFLVMTTSKHSVSKTRRHQMMMKHPGLWGIDDYNYDVQDGDLDLASIGLPMPLGHNQKVILTSKSQAVCGRMGCTEANTVEMKCLGEEDAWSLFQYKTGVEITKANAEIHKFAKLMVSACGGLPGAICSVGTAVAGVTCCELNPDDWWYAYERFKVNELPGCSGLVT
ncbi:hypothetical protein ACQ4PT_014326 [Festuca glaucescens]